MPTLTIGTRGTYDDWNCVFKYEIRGYMSQGGTIIKINNYGYVILICGSHPENRFLGRFEDDYDDGDYDDSKENVVEADDSKYKSEENLIQRIKLDETIFQKIKKIINDNVKTLATMGGLEPEPDCVLDGCFSRIFLGGDDMSIQAEISNLGQYRIKSEGSDQNNEYDLLDDMWGESNKKPAENMTKLMNVFFRIRDILTENGIDREYFEY